MENIQQFIVTTKVVACYLLRLNTASHILVVRVPDLQHELDWALMFYHVSLNCCTKASVAYPYESQDLGLRRNEDPDYALITF